MTENENIKSEIKSSNRLEKKVFVFSVSACLAIFSYAYFIDDNPIRNLISDLPSKNLGDVNYNINCDLANNKNSPYCQEKHAKVQESWRSVTISGSKASKFRLYKK